MLFDLDAQMSMTQAISLDAEGNSSGKFEKWYNASIVNDRTIFSVLKMYLDGNLNKFHPDNGFIFRLKDSFHFVPSTEQLYWLEMETLDPSKGKNFIREVLGKIGNSGALPKCDYVLFDCPPSFTMLSYSVLASCDLILIPFNPDFFAANGIQLLVAGLRHKIQPHPLPKIAVFANRARTWSGEPTRAARAWISEVRSACESVGKQIGHGVYYLDSWIADRASIRDAITNGRTPDAFVSEFRALWDEATKVMVK